MRKNLPHKNIQDDTCKYCERNSICFKQTGIRRRILGSSCYPAFYRGHERIGSDTYWHMMRLRKIWAEGSFSVLKREHGLSKIRKRGIPAVTEECLLAVMALNLKRMVKAILLFLHKLKIWDENVNFKPKYLFCQQVQLLTQSQFVFSYPPLLCLVLTCFIFPGSARYFIFSIIALCQERSIKLLRKFIMVSILNIQ